MSQYFQMSHFKNERKSVKTTEAHYNSIFKSTEFRDILQTSRTVKKTKKTRFWGLGEVG